jgi:fatty acid synthase subunit alpha, fungi type
VLALEPSIVQDAAEGGEGQPSPMLSINGLLLSALRPHIEATNKHLPPNSQLAISLYNGPRNFVVTGPPRALYGLVTNLRKVRALSRQDQNKIPYSQRKPTFSSGVRFLVVNAPYHSSYLESATDKLCNGDLDGEELWTPDELGIPVFNTEDGGLYAWFPLPFSLNDPPRFRHAQELDVDYSIIVWSDLYMHPFTGILRPRSQNPQVIDFGPGGVNGIGPLTARNLGGRGIRVIILGDNGRGEAEFSDIEDVQYEDSEWWSKKYAPGLVKTR